MDWRVKPRSSQKRKHRVAHPSMQPRHGAGKNPASTRRQPASQDEFASSSQLFQKERDLPEVVTIVGVDKNNVMAFRGIDATHQCVPVSLFWHRNDARSGG